MLPSVRVSDALHTLRFEPERQAGLQSKYRKNGEDHMFETWCDDCGGYTLTDASRTAAHRAAARCNDEGHYTLVTVVGA
jgi:rRNA maturation protein Nop10